MTRWPWAGALLPWVILASFSTHAQSQTDDLAAAVDRLGDFEYAVRMEASRVLRRAEPNVAVPLLLEAVRSHEDSYVQFRALVLVYGFDLPRAGAVFGEALESENDRVRAAAYEYFEQFPSHTVVPKLVAALDTETSEFVRPYLVRALAANDDEPEVQARLVQDIDRGEGYFRGAVIEALGDHGADYAVDALIQIAVEEGPLRDEALLALGKLGDRRALVQLGRVQAASDETLQPVVSAAACLLDADCEAQLQYVVEALRYGAEIGNGDNQELLRSATSGLAALAMAGRRDALAALFEVGLTANDTARAPIALALGTVALRNPSVVMTALHEGGRDHVPEAELLLMREAFDMLDDDFAEERFYVLMRGDFWEAPEGSSARAVAEAAIRILEF